MPVWKRPIAAQSETMGRFCVQGTRKPNVKVKVLNADQ